MRMTRTTAEHLKRRLSCCRLDKKANLTVYYLTKTVCSFFGMQRKRNVTRQIQYYDEGGGGSKIGLLRKVRAGS